jgi:AraC-like DNA-binding protein/class 3 adenylate cyclase
MPLFMDYHLVSDIDIDAVKQGHKADKSIQDKYGVKYLQFWVNQEAGTIFCLIEAPDKESCERVHQEAHGNIACQIVRIESGFYKLFMGESHQLDDGIVVGKDGDLDKAYRFVLAIDIWGITKATGSKDFSQLILPGKPKKLIQKIIPSYNGREVKNSDCDEFLCVFTQADEAMECAIEIQKELLKRMESPEDESWNITFKMGLGGGQPVTMSDQLFDETIKLARRLSLIAGDGEIFASNMIRKLSEIEEKPKSLSALKAIQSAEEEFLEQLFNITEENLSDHAFNIEKLCYEIGISRSQLYRKVTAVTGRSPVTFIRDIRLNKALSLIKENKYNLSEIALEIGYNSPSYFSKCFREKYGVKASKVAI